MKSRPVSFTLVGCMLLIVSCTQLGVTVSTSSPADQTVTITGPATVSKASPAATFTVAYQGSARAYQ